MHAYEAERVLQGPEMSAQFPEVRKCAAHRDWVAVGPVQL